MAIDWGKLEEKAAASDRKNYEAGVRANAVLDADDFRAGSGGRASRASLTGRSPAAAALPTASPSERAAQTVQLLPSALDHFSASLTGASRQPEPVRGQDSAAASTLPSGFTKRLRQLGGALQQVEDRLPQLRQANTGTALPAVRDRETIQREIDGIDAQLSQLQQRRDSVAWDDSVFLSGDASAVADRMDQQRGQLTSLDAEIARLNQQRAQLSGELDSAQRVYYTSLAERPDFRQYADQGAAIENPTVQEAEGVVSLFGWRPGAKPVGNIVTYSRDNYDQIALSDGHMVGRALYHFMTDDEVDIYNYLLAREGEQPAQAYLDSLEETLNQRWGSMQAENIQDIGNPVGRAAATGLYGLGAGLDQFGSGVRQAFSAERLPTSATQYGSAQIRAGLSDAGPQVAGSSLGQMGYDAVTSLGNMAPSILVGALTGGAGASAAVAQAAGAATMGVSASGNAYGQALAEGYSQEQARNYSLLIGASEGGLQYLLGGIGSLGGKLTGRTAQAAIQNIDNALLRVAADVGVHMAGEGTEEYLQTVLEPVYRNLLLDENNEIQLVSEDAAYSFLMGAVTAGLLEGGGTISSSLDLDKTGRAVRASGQVDALVDHAMALDTGSQAGQMARQMRGGSLRASDINVGQLLKTYAQEGGSLDFMKAPAAGSADVAAAPEAGAETLPDPGREAPQPTVKTTPLSEGTEGQAATLPNVERGLMTTLPDPGAGGQNNTASAVREAGAGTRYTPIEASAIKREGKTFRNLVAGFDSTVASFFKKWSGGRKSHTGEKLEKLYLGKLADASMQKVSSILGYPLERRDIILTNDNVKHIVDEHGDAAAEIRKGNLPLGDWVFDSLQEVVLNPDSIEAGHSGTGKNTGKTGIRFIKSLPNGTVVCVQFDNKGRETMEITTLYAKESAPSVVDTQNRIPTHTSETTEPALSSTLIIPNSPVESNTQSPDMRSVHRQDDGAASTAGRHATGVHSKDTTPPSTPIIADDTAGGNSQSTPTGPESSVGAARAGFDPWSHFQGQRSQFHPEGANAARPVDVPTTDPQGNLTRKTASTAMGAGAIPDEAVGDIQRMVLAGQLSYQRNGDKGSINRAVETIRDKGFQRAMEEFSASVRKGLVSKDLATLGQQLLVNAANAGDGKATAELLSLYAQMETSAGQAVQAASILRKLSPSDQLYAAQRTVGELERTLSKRYKDLELTIDEALLEKFTQQTDQAGRDGVLEEIYQNIADQIPASWKDKWNAWRYLAMLANPRTHIRNIVGNVGFQPLRMAKDRVAAAIEAGVSGLSGGKLERTKSFAANPALYRAAWNDWDNVSQALSGNKYDDAVSQIEGRRRIFSLPMVEGLRRGNSNLLELEDAVFKRLTYADALAGYLQANGVDARQMTDGTVDASLLSRARDYAGQEALRATYQDRNAVSDLASSRYRGKGAGVVNAAMDAVLTFRRTPANILVRGLEYSPAGLLKSLTYDLAKVRRGEMSGAAAIDGIAAGLTGSGLLALGAYLFAQGLVSSGGGDDEGQDALNELAGGQSYALNLPGGGSVTLDWLAPEALPFFMGVELMDAMGQGGNTAESILSAIKSAASPMLELSMLQSLNDMLDSVSFSEDKLGAIAASALVSYFSQAIPTIGGQLERTAEDRRMSTYTDKNNALPTDLQYALGRASARIPGWDYQQVPYVDAWGREESTGTLPMRAFNNFLNPAYTSSMNVTDVDAEVQRLYDQTGDSGVVPERPGRYVIVDGARKDLSGQEYVQYATQRGQSQYEMLEGMLDNPAYQGLSDADKAAVVADVYSYADATAKASVSGYQPDGWVARVAESGADPAGYILYRHSGAQEGQTLPEQVQALEEAGITGEAQARLLLAENPTWADKAGQAGVSEEVYVDFKVATAGIVSDRDRNGNTISGSKKEKVLAAIDGMGISRREKDALYYAAGYAESGLQQTPWH